MVVVAEQRQLVVYTMCTLCTSLRDTYLHPMYSAATRDVRSARPGAELLRQGNRQTVRTRLRLW